MKNKNMGLSFWTSIAWFSFVFCIGGLGTYLTYNEPLTTDAWLHWIGPNAWKMDALRLMFAILVSFYVWWLLGNIRSGNFNIRELRALLPNGRTEWVILLVVSFIFLYAVCVYLPSSFEDIMSNPKVFEERGLMQNNAKLKVVHDKISNPLNDPAFNLSKELHRPAVPYFFYQLGFWFGAIWPMFNFILRTARQDWKIRTNSIVQFKQYLPKKPFTNKDANTKKFDVLLTAFHLRCRGIRERAQRYLSILLVLILCLIYENSTASHGTTLPEALELAKFAVWVFLGPVFVLFLTVVITGYHNTVEQVRSGIDMFIRSLTESGDNTELLDRARKFDDELITSKSGLAFLTTVLKSSSIAIPLLITIVGYVLQSVTEGEWVNIFVPKLLIDFVTNLYSGY